MNSSRRPICLRPFRLPSLLTSLVLAGLFGAVFVASAAAWGPREAAPLEPLSGSSATSLSLLPDGSAVWLVRDRSNYKTPPRLARRPAGGLPGLAPLFPAAFTSSGSDSLFLSPADAAGNLFAVQGSSTTAVMRLAPGANPGTGRIEPIDKVSAIDLAPSGEAAALLGGGSTQALSFRAAGPAASFDTPRPLDRRGNQRSYALGVTIDPDGGVFAVYETEQDTAVLQAYAPPGGDFGPASLVDVPANVMSYPGLEPFYEQSTNGHGVLVWPEYAAGNSVKVYAATRRPGGLLGAKSLVAEAPSGRSITPTSAGITDDGTVYVASLGGVRNSSPCETNIHGIAGGQLAVRAPGSNGWATTLMREGWADREDPAQIRTAGNRVGVVFTRTVLDGKRCTQNLNPATEISVRLGTGASLGAPVTIAKEGNTAPMPGSNLVRPNDLAVDGTGRAILLTSEPEGDGRRSYVYFHEAADGGSGDGGGGKADPKPLPAPGKVRLGGTKLRAKADGSVSVVTSCVRARPGDRVYCTIGTKLETKMRAVAGNIASASRSKQRKRAQKAKQAKKRGRVKLKRIAAKRVRVAPGKSRRVKLKLNRAGKRLLKQRKRLKVTLTVKIRKGARSTTIRRKVTILAAKPKTTKRGKGKARGKGGRR